MTFLPRLCTALLCLCAAPLTACADAPRRYDVEYSARFVPDDGIAEVRIAVSQTGGALIELDFAAPADHYMAFAADGGTVTRDDARVVWRVPAAGGAISLRAVVDHRRGDAYDARMTPDWALLRLDDLFPPAKVRSLKGARSVSSLALTGPAGWSFETRYGPVDAPRPFSDPRRRFDRPTGWMIVGQLGVRRDTITERRITIAGPRNQSVHRIDTLAFLRWTLPDLIDVFPGFPERLLVVSARSQMWRGGLSGPDSLYLHASRPLISENGTSTALHELVHVAMRASDARMSDWIVEGLAEYYSLEILRRSGGISEERFDAGLEHLRNWAAANGAGLREPSRGPDTAHATLLFAALADELAAAGLSLDALVRELATLETVDGDTLMSTATELLGHPPRSLEGIAPSRRSRHDVDDV